MWRENQRVWRPERRVVITVVAEQEMAYKEILGELGGTKQCLETIAWSRDQISRTMRLIDDSENRAGALC